MFQHVRPSLLAAAATSLLALAGAGAFGAEQPMIGEAAPDFSLDTVAGDTLGLADLKGRYVVLHFGASW